VAFRHLELECFPFLVVRRAERGGPERGISRLVGTVSAEVGVGGGEGGGLAFAYIVCGSSLDTLAENASTSRATGSHWQEKLEFCKR
jgi:hypothetical protein